MNQKVGDVMGRVFSTSELYFGSSRSVSDGKWPDETSRVRSMFRDRNPQPLVMLTTEPRIWYVLPQVASQSAPYALSVQPKVSCHIHNSLRQTSASYRGYQGVREFCRGVLFALQLGAATACDLIGRVIGVRSGQHVEVIEAKRSVTRVASERKRKFSVRKKISEAVNSFALAQAWLIRIRRIGQHTVVADFTERPNLATVRGSGEDFSFQILKSGFFDMLGARHRFSPPRTVLGRLAAYYSDRPFLVYQTFHL
jgi:hypothetical protein